MVDGRCRLPDQAATVGRGQRVRVVRPGIGIAGVQLQCGLISSGGIGKLTRDPVRTRQREPGFHILRFATGHGLQLCCAHLCPLRGITGGSGSSGAASRSGAAWRWSAHECMRDHCPVRVFLHATGSSRDRCHGRKRRVFYSLTLTCAREDDEDRGRHEQQARGSEAPANTGLEARAVWLYEEGGREHCGRCTQEVEKHRNHRHFGSIADPEIHTPIVIPSSTECGPQRALLTGITLFVCTSQNRDCIRLHMRQINIRNTVD